MNIKQMIGTNWVDKKTGVKVTVIGKWCDWGVEYMLDGCKVIVSLGRFINNYDKQEIK